jgi:hypothetical protein
MLKAIHASEDIVAAREKAVRVIEKLRGLRLTRAAELVEAVAEETLTYYAFPEEHWRRIRTNNPLEHILREIRRRTRVVGAFPDGNPRSTGRGQTTPHRRHRLVDPAIFEPRAAEPAYERCHHRLSQRRAPLSPNQMCEKILNTTLVSEVSKKHVDSSHAPDSHATRLVRIPPRIQMLDLVH